MIKQKLFLHFIGLNLILAISFVLSVVILAYYHIALDNHLLAHDNKQTLVQILNSVYPLSNALQVENQTSHLYGFSKEKSYYLQHLDKIYLRTNLYIQKTIESNGLKYPNTLFSQTFSKLNKQLQQITHYRQLLKTNEFKKTFDYYQELNQQLFNLYSQTEAYLQNESIEPESVLLQSLFLLKSHMQRENNLRIQQLLAKNVDGALQQQILLAQENQKNIQNLFIASRNVTVYASLNNQSMDKNLNDLALVNKTLVHYGKTPSNFNLNQWLKLYHQRLSQVQTMEQSILDNWKIRNKNQLEQLNTEKNHLRWAMVGLLLLLLLAVWIYHAFWRKTKLFFNKIQRHLQNILHKLGKKNQNLLQSRKKYLFGASILFNTLEELENTVVQYIEQYNKTTHELVNIHNVFNVLPVNLMLLDQNNIITYINQPLRRLLQQVQIAFQLHLPEFSASSLLGNNWSIFDFLTENAQQDGNQQIIVLHEQQLYLEFIPIFNPQNKGQLQGTVVCWALKTSD